MPELTWVSGLAWLGVIAGGLSVGGLVGGLVASLVGRWLDRRKEEA